MRNISRISSLLALVSIGVFCDRYTKIFFENTPDISLF